MSELSFNDGLGVLDGDFNIWFNLEEQRKYVDGSSVSCTFPEMIDYRKEATADSIYQVSYSGMDGYAQDMNSGIVMLYFPIENSLQNSLDYPIVLEVILAHKWDEVKGSSEFEASKKALDDFIATDEVQNILNSIKLLPGQS